MTTEIIHDNVAWELLIKEAEEILSRLPIHQGEFGYISSVRSGHLLELVIRPMRDDMIVNGQPVAHQHSDLYILSATNQDKKLHIARYHH